MLQNNKTNPAEIAALLQTVRDVYAAQERSNALVPRNAEGLIDTTALLLAFAAYVDELTAGHADEVAALTQELDAAIEKREQYKTVYTEWLRWAREFIRPSEPEYADIIVLSHDLRFAIEKRVEQAEAQLATARQELADTRTQLASMTMRRDELEDDVAQPLQPLVREKVREAADGAFVLGATDDEVLDNITDAICAKFGTPRTEADLVKGLVEIGYTKAKLRTSDGWHEGADGYTRRPKYDCDILIAPTPEAR